MQQKSFPKKALVASSWSGRKTGRFAKTPRLYFMWAPGDKKIAQLELSTASIKRRGFMAACTPFISLAFLFPSLILNAQCLLSCCCMRWLPDRVGFGTAGVSGGLTIRRL